MADDDFEIELPDGDDYDEEIDDEEDVIPDDEDESETEDEEDVLDDFEAQAKAEYANRMKVLGFKLDDNGEVIGFEEVKPVAKTTEEATENYDDLFNDTNALEQRLMTEVAPLKIDNYVKNVVQSNSKLAKYEKEVRTILSQTDPRTITPAVVENYFWWARGQNADKEIAEAMKVKTDKTVERVAKGKAAVSESAVGKVTGKSKDAPITPLIAKLAKGWGVDAQKMANDQRDAQAKGNK